MARTLVRHLLGSLIAVACAGALEATEAVTIEASVGGTMGGVSRSDVEGPASAGSHLYEGVDASIGDPLKLGSDPGVSGVIAETEPVAIEGATWTAVKSLFGDPGR